jgi:hypothetical protein
MFGQSILHQVTVRDGRAFQIDVTGPPPLHVSAWKVLHGTKVNPGGGGGGFVHIRIQFFSAAPRLYCYQGACNSLAIGTEENSEIVRSTYLSPSLKRAYVSFSLQFSLSTPWGDDFGCSNG